MRQALSRSFKYVICSNIDGGSFEWPIAQEKLAFLATPDKYEAIAPKPIESWEGYDWFSHKKKWYQFIKK